MQAGARLVVLAGTVVGHQGVQVLLELLALAEMCVPALQEWQRCQDVVEQLFLRYRDMAHLSLHSVQLPGCLGSLHMQHLTQ